MADFDWSWAKDLLAGAAPILGGMFGGPLGATAAKMIADRVIGNPNASQKDVADVITKAAQGDPELMLKLKTLETEAAEKMKEMDVQITKMKTDLQLEEVKAEVEEKKADIDNTKSAREMQMLTRSLMPAILTWITLILFSAGMIALFVWGLPKDDATKNIVIMGMTLIFGCLNTCFGFYLGSSHGSTQKTEMLNKVLSDKAISEEQDK